jgi:hypothetical protein
MTTPITYLQYDKYSLNYTGFHPHQTINVETDGRNSFMLRIPLRDL